jgi:hypothetical protein
MSAGRSVRYAKKGFVFHLFVVRFRERKDSPVSERNVIVEIRAAEGGDDAKDLVNEQAGIYARLAKRRGL